MLTYTPIIGKKTFQDVINFAGESTNSLRMSYSTMSGSLSYIDGVGYETAKDTDVVGRISMSQRPAKNITLRISNIPNEFRQVASSSNYIYTVNECNGKLFAGGSGNKILISSDGYSWEQVTVTGMSYIYKIAYLNGKYFAIGSPGTLIAISDDGVNWDTVDSNGYSSGNLYDIAYSNGVYRACGYYQVVSTNGTDWTRDDSLTSWRYVILADESGHFVTAGNNGCANNTDGSSDYKGTIYPYYYNIYYGLYLNSQYILFSQYGYISTSSSGASSSWTNKSLSGGGSYWVYGFAYADGKYWADFDGYIYSTDANLTGCWQKVTDKYYTTTGNFGNNHLCYSERLGRMFLAYGYYVGQMWVPFLSSRFTLGSSTITDLDGTRNITITPSQFTQSGENYYVEFTMRNIRLLRASLDTDYEVEEERGGRLTFPTNGTLKLTVKPISAWSKLPGNANNILKIGYYGNYYGLCYANGRLYTITSSGRIAYYDMVQKTWGSLSDTAGSGTWYKLLFGNGKLYAANSSGKIRAYDFDNNTWSDLTTNSSITSSSLCFNDSKLYATNISSGTIYCYDIENDTWTEYENIFYATDENGNQWGNCVFVNNKLYAVNRAWYNAKVGYYDFSTGTVTKSEKTTYNITSSYGYNITWFKDKIYIKDYNYGYLAAGDLNLSKWKRSSEYAYSVLSAYGWYSDMVCIANMIFVIHSDSGIIAVYDTAFDSELSKTFKFTNIGDDTVNTITESKTFTIEASQITNRDAHGNYYVDFEMENVKLVSTELTYERTEETGGRLTFPEKGIVRLKVESGYGWERFPGNAKNITGLESPYFRASCYASGTIYTIDVNSGTVAYYNTVNNTWGKLEETAGSGSWQCLYYDSNKLYAASESLVRCYDFSSSNWSDYCTVPGSGTITALYIYNGKLYVNRGTNGDIHCYDMGNDTWNTWEGAYGSGTWYGLYMLDDKLYSLNCNSGTLEYYDPVTSISQQLERPADSVSNSDWYGFCHVNNRFYTTGYSYQGYLARTDMTGSSWKLIDQNARSASKLSNAYWYNVCAAGTKIYMVEYYTGTIVVYDTSYDGNNTRKIKFTNIGIDKEYTISDQKGFQISKSEISAQDEAGNWNIEFEKENVRLLSAEIVHEGVAKVGGKITSSKRGRMTLKVKTASSVGANWQLYLQALNPSGENASTQWCSGKRYNISYGNGVFVLVSWDGYTAYSSDGSSWHRGSTDLNRGYSSNWLGCVWTGSYFVALNRFNKVGYSSDGINWTCTAPSPIYSGCMDDGFLYDTDLSRFYIPSDSEVFVSTGYTGTEAWSTLYTGSTYNILCDGQRFEYGNGYYVVYSGSSMKYSTDGSQSNWVSGSLPIGISCLNYSNGMFLFLTSTGKVGYTSDITSANSWRFFDGSTSEESVLSMCFGNSGWCGLGYGGGKLVVAQTNGDVAVSSTGLIGKTLSGNIPYLKFKNVSGDSSKHEIDGDTEFTIDVPNSVDSDGKYYVEFESDGIDVSYILLEYEQNVPIKGRLLFPKKGDITLTVDNTETDLEITTNWQYYAQALNPSGESTSTSWCSGKRPNISYGNGVFVATSTNGYTAYSTDGISWSRGTYVGSAAGLGCVRTGTHFVTLSYGSGAAYSTDGKTWNTGTPSPNYSGCMDDGFCYDTDLSRLFITADDRTWITSAQDGMSGWTSNYRGNMSFPLCDGQRWEYGKGYYVAYSNSSIKYGSNGTSTSSSDWKSVSLPASVNCICYGVGIFWGLTSAGKLIGASSLNLSSDWMYMDGSASESSHLATISGKTSGWCGLGCGGGKVVACTSAGDVAVAEMQTSDGGQLPSITFKNVDELTERQIITAPQTFEIKSSQISDSKSGGNYYVEFSLDYVNVKSATLTLNVLNSTEQKDITLTEGDEYETSTIRSSEFTLDSDKEETSYYYYLSGTNKYAAVSVDKTEMLDDMIDFATGVEFKNSGILQSSFSGSVKNGFYTVSSGEGRISTKFRGRLELEIAPMFSGDSGTITKLHGENTDEQNITSKTTIVVDRSELQFENGLYYMDFSVSNLIILNVKLLNSEPIIKYPSDLYNSYVINWGNSTVSSQGNILIGGYSSNFSLESGYHQLNTSTCCPTMWNSAHASDITMIFDAESPSLLRMTMPERSDENGEMFFCGINRLFSRLQRDSIRKYSSFEPYSSVYNDKVSIVRTIFSKPYNAVLRNGKNTEGVVFQGDDDTPTLAASKVTTAACQKLKNDYGSSNLRIYVIKYRKQEQYSSFPIYGFESSPDLLPYDYSVVDACATNSEYVYNIADDADSEKNLREKLNEIAADIKSWAGYEAAKLVE